MQFTIIWLDGTDSEAPARRHAVRADHIALCSLIGQKSFLRIEINKTYE